MHFDWWTLALQTVNVLVLIWILARFFFRPVADIVAKRQEETNKLLADAAAAREEAAAIRADAEKAHAVLDAERDRLIAEARNSAQIEKTNLLAQSSQEIAKLHGEAEAAIARDRTAAQQAIIARASEVSVDIAQRLLGTAAAKDRADRIPRWALSGASRTVIRRKRELRVVGGGRWSRDRGRDRGAAYEG